MTWLRSRGVNVLGVAALGLVVVVSTSAPMRPTATIPLYQDGIALTSQGEVVEVPAGRPVSYHPGSRVPIDQIDDASLALAQSQREWLAAGRGVRDGDDAEAVSGALLDIATLTGARMPASEAHADGALVAGWEPRWRYVWPRDASFAAAALATTGHVADAVVTLEYLAAVQEDDGTFAARYLPTGGGVPDGRAAQLDGAGWVLWASNLTVDAAAADVNDSDANALGDSATSDRADVVERLSPLAQRATAALLAATDTETSLPDASPDYWEIDETQLTLGTAGAVLAGLEAAAQMPDVVGEVLSVAAAARAEAVRAAVVDHFGPYYRRHGGSAFADGRDAATAFLLPPIGSAPEGAKQAWLASLTEMARIGGGVAPGATWKQDGISWTPQTSLFALTAAANDEPELARQLLDWLLAHRTESGAIPEKVLADGSPAAVAPLAWSSANVVLAECALEDLAGGG